MKNDRLTSASERGPSGPRSRRPLPQWVSTTALLLPTYGWLTLAVFLPLLTMFVFSFMSATPMG
ncbi:ABC transporter permease, partial [Rhizobium ruizarguesonis]